MDMQEIDDRPYNISLRYISHYRMQLRTLREVDEAAYVLATGFPDPKRVEEGLRELLVNAVEHGNLGITYEEKRELLAQQRWREEVERRLALPEYIGRKVEVLFQRKDGNCLVQITDSGEGFDWERYWHINPARAGEANGRGIACVRLTAFDRMAYNKKGNSVTVVVAENPEAEGDYAW